MRRLAACPRALAALAGALILALAAPRSTAAPRIEKNPSLRLSGSHLFRFDPDGVAGTVSWSLDRETVNDTGLHVRTNGIATRTGLTATFSLSSVSGSETIYYVNATLGAVHDVDTVQVFPGNTKSWFTYQSAGNPDVRVYAVFPSSLSPASRVLLAMHGNSRTASSYADHWRSWASQRDYIVLCPLYDLTNWPGTGDYQLGNVFTGDDCEGSLNQEPRWSFAIDEGIHARVRDGVGLSKGWFDLWGFSGGGQHVHRFMAFRPEAPVRVAITAGSGWYTAPDRNIDCPYGLKDPLLHFTQQDVRTWTEKDMVIMVGTADTVRDAELRVTPRADAQGLNRYQRAAYMYAKGLAANPASRWRKIDVPGVGHDASDMAQAAQSFLQGVSLDAPAPPPPLAQAAAATLDVRPNPLVPGSVLAGERWTAGEEVTIDVHDLAGRRIASRSTPVQGGQWRVAWRDLAGGAPIAPGLYVVRARGRGRHVEHKVLVLR
jgi:hypothetical protein